MDAGAGIRPEADRRGVRSGYPRRAVPLGCSCRRAGGARLALMSTRIGIIGVGAIGSVVGGLLTKAGHDVTLIDQWPDHVEAMKKIGLRLSGTCGEHLIPVCALLIHELQSVAEPFDAVFISVKPNDTEWALALRLSYLKKPDGIIADFQNGINHERAGAVGGAR